MQAVDENYPVWVKVSENRSPLDLIIIHVYGFPSFTPPVLVFLPKSPIANIHVK
jgi:hypothetical protein